MIRTITIIRGGRLYSVGLESDAPGQRISYQSLSPKERQGIKINGEAVVELDIKCSHATILAAIAGEPVPAGTDIYFSPSIPRRVMKMYVTQALGSGSLPKRWANDNKWSYGLPEGAGPPDIGKLQREWAIRNVESEALRCCKVLKRIQDIGYNWADLQFLESEAILEAVHLLAMEHGIPALPVHDSLIVPVSKQAIAKEALAACFEKHVGVKPQLEIK